MRNPLLLVSLLLFACSEAPSDKGDESNEDIPLYGDDGGDGTDGTDGDDGADDGSDGEDLLTGCTAEDLLFEVEARDESGPCTSCGDGEVEVYARVVNPCDTELVLTTRSGCLWTSLEMLNLETGEGMGMGVSCDDAITDWSIPAGEAYEEYASALWGGGTWEVWVRFNDPAGTEVMATIEVTGETSGGGGGSSGGGGSGDGDPEPETGP